MADIKVEDGEAYYFRDDDGENIDPDRDFSYIDRKIENVLGHYQKDFMGGVSAESLGARFGGYGSFLPMQQRTPPIISNQKSQTHVNLKSRQDLPSELQRSHQNLAISANQIPPAKSILASGDQSVEAISESRISSVNSQSKPQCFGAFVPDHQIKKPMINNSGKTSLKFRVKMAPKNVSCLDKSAIYSGLGLDISPSSSPEGSPSENDETSASLQEMNTDSPFFIVNIMTSIPFSHNDLLSPLQDSFVNIKDKEDDVGLFLSGIKDTLPVSIVQEKLYLKERKEERKERKSKVVKDTSKVKRSKQKTQRQKPVEMIKENCEYPAKNLSSSVSTRENNGAFITREMVSNAFTSEVVAEEKDRASLMNKNTASKSSIVFDKRNEAVRLDDDIDIDSLVKHVHVDRQKAKDEPISKHIVKEEVLQTTHSKDKNVIFIPKSEFSSENLNEGKGKNESKEFLKQQNMAKDNVKEEVMDTLRPIEPFVHKKENGFLKMVPKNEEMGSISLENEGKDMYNDVYQEMKHDNMEKVESLKQKSRSKEIARIEQGLASEKENSSSTVKKLKDTQIGVSFVEPPKGRLIVSSLASKNEGINSRINIPSKSNKGDTDQPMEMRRNSVVDSKSNLRKKGKEGSSRDFVKGVSEQESQALTTKLKDKSSGIKISSTSNVGSNIEGDLAGIMTEKALVADVPLAENAPPVTYVEDWVECEKCHKWRLLPLGMSAASLTEKIWTCSMITWLPGMNKCSFSEDDTTNALRALYVPVDSASLVPNKEPGYQDVRSFVNVPPRALNVALPSPATCFDAFPSGGKKKNMVKTDIDAVRQNDVQNFHISVRKDQVRSEMRNSKNLKKLPRESDSVRKSGDGRLSKIEKKRLADVDAYGISKKMKRVHEKSVKANDPDTLRVRQNFAKESPKYSHMKAKIRTQSNIMSKDDGTYNEPGKKRKIKDKEQRESSGVVPSGKSGHLVDVGEHSGTEHKNKKSKSSNIQGREGSMTKGHAIANLGGGGDNSLHKAVRSDQQFHMDRVSRKGPGGRTSEMALELELSDNATTSSSSKLSYKVKAKMNEVKSSHVGSTNHLKVSGSGLESTGVSFQAALKFLHGASLLEPGNNESKSGEMRPNEVYTSTAKLCENCALEYERCNDMASAALAYKCMEVAYMRLVYCNDLLASRDRQELQMVVRVAPQVESPSSSASDIDNLNQIVADSIKDGHSSVDQRSHGVSAGNRLNFMRLLDFTHDMNLAMEASRRSQSAFAAAMPVFVEAGNVEGVSSIKRVLDFSFHDVDGLLHLVRHAMESIKR